MNKKTITSVLKCLLVSVLLIPVFTFGQEDNPIPGYRPRYGDERPGKPDAWNKFFTGGSLGLQFGSQTLIDISPMIGYVPFKNFSLGLDPTYKYYHFRDVYNYLPSSTSNIFGLGVFAQYDIYRGFLAHVEYEYLNYNTKETGSTFTSNQSVESFFVGGGYQQPVSQRTSMYLLVLWNLNDSPYSPYQNPVIRAGIRVGLGK